MWRRKRAWGCAAGTCRENKDLSAGKKSVRRVACSAWPKDVDDVARGDAQLRAPLLGCGRVVEGRGGEVTGQGTAEATNEDPVLYSDEYYAAQKAKRQGLGLIKFIGGLFKLEMLTERIMHDFLDTNVIELREHKWAVRAATTIAAVHEALEQNQACFWENFCTRNP
ncbi:hypothetical protein GGX14DRAFT_393471 [Mycena pura]|uniref:Uncharacterized protein n=1 Tax=Mycena pura TaxID=153505 RepID=A0AAD6VP53_9AGAR|nr:hypothetical protein GGX14DRAFT_393471 [Mycena pura]